MFEIDLFGRWLYMKMTRWAEMGSPTMMILSGARVFPTADAAPGPGCYPVSRRARKKWKY
jgi:hypothetical protein